MQTLIIDTGVREYKLKGSTTGEVVVSFSPTDAYFAEKLFNAFTVLDGKQEEHGDISEMSNQEACAACRKIDQEMREIIDNVLCAPVSEAVFGEVHAYSMAAGLPLWMNLVFAIMDEMQDSFTKEKEATDPRLKKYIDKYKR